MNGPGIGGYQIMDCEWLGPLGYKDSLSELIDCIHYYHYLNDYDGIMEDIKRMRRGNVKQQLLKIAGLDYFDWLMKYGGR